MTVDTYNSLLARLSGLRTEADLVQFADEVRREFSGDPQLGDVMGSIRMAKSGLAIAARTHAHVMAEVSIR